MSTRDLIADELSAFLRGPVIERRREIGATEVIIDAQFTTVAESAECSDQFVTDVAAAAIAPNRSPRDRVAALAGAHPR